MLYRLVLCLFCILVVSLSAQTSIGFKNPEDVTPLLDYRLPTWGYRAMDFRFDIDGNIGKYIDHGDELRSKNESQSFSTYNNISIFTTFLEKVKSSIYFSNQE